MKTIYFIRNAFFVFLFQILFIIYPVAKSQSQSFVEEFDNLPALFTHGWDTINHSTDLAPSWMLPSVFGMNAQSGSSISMTHQAVFSSGGIVNAWLIAPARILNNGDMIYFYTVSMDSVASGLSQPDRMQVRLSTNGSSSFVGLTDTSLGDFTNLLLEINPTLSPLPYPIGYPGSWRRYSITISGLSGPTPGRFAFRYFIENTQGNPPSGPGTNGSAIGFDSLAYVSAFIDGLNDLENEIGKMNVYPDQSGDIFNFILPNPKDAIRKIELYNLFGEKIKESVNSVVSLSMFPDGIYLYSVSTYNGKVFQEE